MIAGMQFQEEYIRFLIQNIDMRKEIQQTSEDILSLQEINEADRKTILNLQQNLKDLERELIDNRRKSSSIQA